MIGIYLLLALLLVALTKLPVAVAMHRAGGYDNSQPRLQQSDLDGWGRRAVAAHHNALEAIPVFGLALLAAAHLEVAARVIDGLAITFFVARLVYQYCYLADWASLRTLAWAVGYVACLGLVAAGL
ncbi:MAPEG family protein [Exilibacterium tricleocarpae]|uniref:MAPEG family protein n=1 Tax=Exilibacterium tricleocarpae TaxID=2591008 RepID=A0A545TFH0_9GAMM|nr:MAPEG family protein [Exilibacterium tricleocarpae]TQV75931.1 MAPEG family protein [Exilibacterium tricleocarpae]